MSFLNLDKIVMNQISPNATIGKNCKFGVGVVIDDNVTIGDDNVFGNHVVITGNVEIGSKNFFSDLISNEIPNPLDFSGMGPRMVVVKRMNTTCIIFNSEVTIDQA